MTRKHSVVMEGVESAMDICMRLVNRSQWFEFEPLPDDQYEFTVKEEVLHLLYIHSEPVSEDARASTLVAAAPDLLAACKALAAWADRECMPMGGKNDAPWEAMDAAIAKAEGRTA